MITIYKSTVNSYRWKVWLKQVVIKIAYIPKREILLKQAHYFYNKVSSRKSPASHKSRVFINPEGADATSLSLSFFRTPCSLRCEYESHSRCIFAKNLLYLQQHALCLLSYVSRSWCISRLSLYLSEIECSLTMAVYISKRPGSLARATYTCVRVLNPLIHLTCIQQPLLAYLLRENAQPSSSLFPSARLHFLTMEYLCCINRRFRSYVIPYYASKG